MITYSIIQKTQLEGAHRIDADYFQPEYLEVEKKLSEITTKKISEISDSVVNFGAYSLCNYIVWQDSGIPYLNVENIKEGYIDFENVKFIDDKVNEILSKSKVKEGQIILPMAGTIGNSAVAYKVPAKINSNQATAKITLKQNISPFYVTAFLNSHYGKTQITREILSSVQSNIFLWQIKNFKVPLISNEKQKQIETLWKNGLDELDNSKILYQQAEELFLEELGLRDFEVEDDLGFIVNLSDVKSANRVDADYFQPKYEKLISKIELKGTNKLEDFVKDYSTGFPFKSEYYQEDGIPLIRINNIKKGFIDLSDTAYLSDRDHSLSPKDTAKPGDIVLSMSGTIGMSAVIPADVPKCSVNQRILRFTQKGIDNDYLTLVLNSIVGSYQLARIGTGGVQTNISYKDIQDILIPDLPKPTQQKIAGLVRKSYEAREKSKELLEKAKRKVEEMIENGNIRI